MNTRAVTRSQPDAKDPPPARLKTGVLPQKPPGMSWRDHLIMLLQTGAEIEQCLMVQYLFAAYSLNEDQPTVERRQKVRVWREAILTVAKEEMGHLLTVQNLLCLIGGPVSFERRNFPWDTHYLPFPFKLEKVTPKSIAWYLYAEAPLLWDDPTANRKVRDELKEELKEVNQLAAAAVDQDLAHTVGQLYAEIHAIVANENQIPDSAFRAESYSQQASWDDWGRGYRPPPAAPGTTEAPKEGSDSRAHVLILRAATRTDALAALEAVGGQGEAAHFRDSDSDEPSHFQRFREVLADMQKNPDFDPSLNVAENPTVLEGAALDENSNPIEAVTSKRLAHLFNNRYRSLLVCLAHTYKIAPLVDPNEPNVRGALMHHIFGEMYNLKALAGLLVRMPLQDPPDEHLPNPRLPVVPGKIGADPEGARRPYDPAKRAGPPFDMPYSMHIPNDEIDRWRHYQDILKNSQALCEELLAENDPHSRAFAAQFPEGVRYIKTLSQLDARAVKWLDTVLAGLKAR